MSYNYQEQKKNLFSETGSVMYTEGRDVVKQMLKECGAFRMQEFMGRYRGCAETWDYMAIVDRMIELKELEVWERGSWAQYKIYTTPERSNR